LTAVARAEPLQDPLEESITQLLAGLGEDPAREGLIETPRRAADALRAMTDGYSMTVADVVGDALFACESSGLVTVRDISFYSTCEHHMLPFFGKAHVGYLPAGKVLGISKIPRLVDLFAHRFQLQERLTQQVADAIMEVTGARGAAVVMSARHLCVEMRGVGKTESVTVTSCSVGDMREEPSRSEFFGLLGSAV
jgi:GTP cyclohydrolase IA